MNTAQKPLSQHLSEWSHEKLRGILRSVVQPIAEAAAQIAMPSVEELEQRLRKPAETEAKRQLLFTIMSHGPIPAAAGDRNGTGAATGAPQKPFQAYRMIIPGTTVPTSSPGGTKGLLLTALFVGSDLQLVNVPGGQSGVPVHYFASTAFDAKFRFDIAYPAVAITLNAANPTSHDATLFMATFVGEAAKNYDAPLKAR